MSSKISGLVFDDSASDSEDDLESFRLLSPSVSDPFHFDMDPDPFREIPDTAPNPT